MIILVDDEDRENEGDFVMAAQHVTAEAITLMTRHASGIITVPMPEERLLALNLELMVRENSESMRTAFTITVDAREGTTTGSSAADRALTIRKLADPEAQARRLQPARPCQPADGAQRRRPEAGGTYRSGRGSDAAGGPAAGRRHLRDHGRRRRDGPRARAGANWRGKFDLKFITIAELIKYRRRTEKLIQQVAPGADCRRATASSRSTPTRATWTRPPIRPL